MRKLSFTAWGTSCGWACVLTCLCLASAAQAETAAARADAEVSERVVREIAPYRPEAKISGTLRLWGHGSFRHDFMRQLIDAWIKAFNEHQPEVRFDYRMYGTASAVGAVYTGAGDIALLGEEISPAAARAFLRAKGYAHTDISVATGSVATNYFDYAHMIFVHRDNPTRRMSLRQLDAIFGVEHRRSGANIRTWGELGLAEPWTAHRIQPYGWKTDVDFALFFRERVLEHSHRWNPALEEYEHLKRTDGTQYDHGQRILDALAADPHGIAISNVRYARSDVRALSLAWDDEGPWYEATAENLIRQRYPLVRIIPAIIDRPPGQPLKPALREFLSFVLSREGQRILVANSGYLPIDPAVARRESKELR